MKAIEREMGCDKDARKRFKSDSSATKSVSVSDDATLAEISLFIVVAVE